MGSDPRADRHEPGAVSGGAHPGTPGRTTPEGGAAVHPSDPRSIAARCLACWTGGDLDGLRELLTDDVTFDGPLGHTQGADEYVRGVARMAEIVTTAEQQQLI